MAERQPTIEQKSTFSSKAKDGSDIEFIATIKFFISPTGDVRINAPGGTSGGGGPGGGRLGDGTGAGPLSGNNAIGAPSAPEDKDGGGGKEDAGDAKRPEGKGPKTEKGGESSAKADDKKRPGNGKFQSNKDIDKQIPRSQGDCPITQFIPDPCKAIDDLTKSIKGLFGYSGGENNHRPRDASNFAKTPNPENLVTGEVNHAKDKSGNEIIDKQIKYDV